MAAPIEDLGRNRRAVFQRRSAERMRVRMGALSTERTRSRNLGLDAVSAEPGRDAVDGCDLAPDEAGLLWACVRAS